MFDLKYLTGSCNNSKDSKDSNNNNNNKWTTTTTTTTSSSCAKVSEQRKCVTIISLVLDSSQKKNSHTFDLLAIQRYVKMWPTRVVTLQVTLHDTTALFLCEAIAPLATINLDTCGFKLRWLGSMGESWWVSWWWKPPDFWTVNGLFIRVSVHHPQVELHGTSILSLNGISLTFYNP